MLIDGKRRNFKNRKYCLDCSPFNCHNTVVLYNNLKCKICNNNLQGNRTKFCSIKCKQKDFYNNEKIKGFHYKDLIGFQRKVNLIELKGGKCMGCGYDKNISALDFHHRNSNEKEFSLDMRILSNSKWINIIKEVDKCDLLCSNCHREKHYPENTFENIKIILKNNLKKGDI